MNTKPMDMNKIDIVQPTPRRACEHFSPTCSYCKHEAPHPSPVHSDWSSKDWGSDKAKAKEQESLIDVKPPKQDNDRETDQQTDTGNVTDVDDIPFQNLTLQQDKLKEELLDVTDSLVTAPTALAMADDNIKESDGGLMEQELRLQKEEKEYNRIYMSAQLVKRKIVTQTQMTRHILILVKDLN